MDQSATQHESSTPLIMNGTKVAQDIRETLKTEVMALRERPGLAVILVGDNPASKAYVGMKKKACLEIGMDSFDYVLAASEGEKALIELIKFLNADEKVHGILLQLPLPEGYDEEKILSLIRADKDVDGFHPENVGNLLLGRDTFRSCTPYGVMKLLEYYQIDPAGKHVVILGRSNIVGKPLAAMLIQKEKGANATVTICHSRSKNLSEITKQADILIAAIGSANYVTADMVKPGSVVIDVGINRVDDNSDKRGYRLVGDVDYGAVSKIASAITPVPGGVGPMTIAMLLSNTLKSFKQFQVK